MSCFKSYPKSSYLGSKLNQCCKFISFNIILDFFPKLLLPSLVGAGYLYSCKGRKEWFLGRRVNLGWNKVKQDSKFRKQNNPWAWGQGLSLKLLA